MARWLAHKTKRRVAVHTVDNRSLTGVLAGVYADVVVVTHAQLLEPGGSAALDGAVAIPRAQVAFVQVLPAQETP